MTQLIGIRREDKNKWERRVPLTPEHVSILKEKYGIQTIIQPSSIRIFSDRSYQDVGALVQENISECSVIFAVKEIPKELILDKKTYVFFSHTIKGQSYNMPLLQRMIDAHCTLIDYERVVDENNRRLIFFGRYAGMAGMVDTLWGFAQRLIKQFDVESIFTELKRTYRYYNLQILKQHISDIGNHIETHGLPEEITPLIVGFAGYGNVSQGAQEMLDILPTIELHPDQLDSPEIQWSSHHIYKVIFKEKDMVTPRDKNHTFDLQEYYQHPEKYVSIFEQYLPHLNILMNCIYWDTQYPRLVTKSSVSDLTDNNVTQRPFIIGDISVDINGAIEPTMKVTTPDSPIFVYDPQTETINQGVTGKGLAIMAVDNLPCELPADSSKTFSDTLFPFVPNIVQANYSRSYEELDLEPEIKKAVILYKGELTSSYQYINKYL